MKRRKKRDGSVEISINCALCGSKDKMEINVHKRVFHCWSCQRSGRLSSQEVDKFLPFLSDSLTKGLTNGKFEPGFATSQTNTTTTKETYNPELPDVARRYIETRGFDPDWLSYRYRIAWDEHHSRICFPCGSGWSRRAIYPWQEPKTITDAPRDILGGHLITKDSHVVITEGDFKSASIPLPWVGVGLCGKNITDFQCASLAISSPKRVFILLDSGENRASEEVIRRIQVLRPVLLRNEYGRLSGSGPDDISRSNLTKILLEGEQNADWQGVEQRARHGDGSQERPLDALWGPVGPWRAADRVSGPVGPSDAAVPLTDATAGTEPANLVERDPYGPM